MAKLFPRMIHPITSNKILAIKEKSLAESGVNLAIKTATPVIPPKVKLFANLKSKFRQP